MYKYHRTKGVLSIRYKGKWYALPSSLEDDVDTFYPDSCIITGRVRSYILARLK